ncbi:TetR/AcrR family transcriptional regulator [Pseudomonas sp. S 311-6]|jgi:AcrR family transcriptional regulator|uniref:TetR family transcriptional regulator n=1 Tax=Kerstersia gyiorum TaxID=206506 RepID=A0A171KR56_9BURK|nr:TetR/AcrR family transcriptional regulator [Kerstersia gyiorum]AZV92888.1 TetR family transcriptional regulator [Bordetella sp. J329]MCO7641321.1 TetR/AcrR family transcriptional regulator [Pseudomonas sp. S 311-6]KKO71373.1 TetR family transcriptional regulator [Kerstersia gyiorum]MCH4271036.1 TetR/AcrR family transcriptional regulator [Kerstersia gyiorum]MCI1227831.1 TetR/AcrR family transcriptional regulator [Kerstersia gyiorum]
MARTRAADFEEKQRSILTSAAAVFAELGMEKASMAQIASRSKVSKALLYHYYPSKDALIFDIIRSHLEELDHALEVTEEESKGDDAETRLRKLVRQILECYRDADDMHKVQLNRSGSLTDEQAQELNLLERRIVRRISAVIHEINPQLDEHRPLLKPVTMSLFGMLNWVYMWFRPDGPVSREEYADIATTLVLEGLKAIK